MALDLAEAVEELEGCTPSWRPAGPPWTWPRSLQGTWPKDAMPWPGCCGSAWTWLATRLLHDPAEPLDTARLLAVSRVVTLIGTAHVGTTGRLP